MGNTTDICKFAKLPYGPYFSILIPFTSTGLRSESMFTTYTHKTCRNAYLYIPTSVCLFSNGLNMNMNINSSTAGAVAHRTDQMSSGVVFPLFIPAHSCERVVKREFVERGRFPLPFLVSSS
jgi:hypothetical protein